MINTVFLKKPFREILGAAPSSANSTSDQEPEQEQERERELKPKRKRNRARRRNINAKATANVEFVPQAQAQAEEVLTNQEEDNEGFQTPKNRRQTKEPHVSRSPYTGPKTDFTFDMVHEGKFYLVREKPNYRGFGAKHYETYLMKCVKKYFQADKPMIHYMMVVDLGMGPNCEDVCQTFRTDEFSPKKFRRCPRDLFDNYFKYEKSIHLQYFDEEIALDYCF
jgi:hypothetical protein